MNFNNQSPFICIVFRKCFAAKKNRKNSQNAFRYKLLQRDFVPDFLCTDYLSHQPPYAYKWIVMVFQEWK